MFSLCSRLLGRTRIEKYSDSDSGIGIGIGKRPTRIDIFEENSDFEIEISDFGFDSSLESKRDFGRIRFGHMVERNYLGSQRPHELSVGL